MIFQSIFATSAGSLSCVFARNSMYFPCCDRKWMVLLWWCVIVCCLMCSSILAAGSNGTRLGDGFVVSRNVVANSSVATLRKAFHVRGLFGYFVSWWLLMCSVVGLVGSCFISWFICSSTSEAALIKNWGGENGPEDCFKKLSLLERIVVLNFGMMLYS